MYDQKKQQIPILHSLCFEPIWANYSESLMSKLFKPFSKIKYIKKLTKITLRFNNFKHTEVRIQKSH